VLNEIAGLPGAPVRISQAAATYQQGAGNAVGIGLAGPSVTGTPPVYHLLLPDQLLGSLTATSELASAARSTAGREILASVIGDGPSASQAQHAVMAALIMAVRLPDTPPGTPPTATYAAARRFAALPASARHAWLMRHLTALRADRITLAQLP